MKNIVEKNMKSTNENKINYNNKIAVTLGTVHTHTHTCNLLTLKGTVKDYNSYKMNARGIKNGSVFGVQNLSLESTKKTRSFNVKRIDKKEEMKGGVSFLKKINKIVQEILYGLNCFPRAPS